MDERKELNDYWKTRWKEGRFAWHMDGANPHLVEFFPRLEDGDLTGKRVLVPLCGKTVDLRWFYEKGMSVVGVELSELAVRAFFTENGFDFKVEDCSAIPECKIFKHDERLRIYLSDLFKLDVNALGGEFDFLWDRGALVAMMPAEQKRYWNLISSFLSDKGQVLLECFEYEPGCREAHPYSIPFDELNAILENSFTAKEIHRRDKPADEHPPLGHEATYVIYHMKRKSDDSTSQCVTGVEGSCGVAPNMMA